MWLRLSTANKSKWPCLVAGSGWVWHKMAFCYLFRSHRRRTVAQSSPIACLFQMWLHTIYINVLTRFVWGCVCVCVCAKSSDAAIQLMNSLDVFRCQLKSILLIHVMQPACGALSTLTMSMTTIMPLDGTLQYSIFSFPSFHLSVFLAAISLDIIVDVNFNPNAECIKIFYNCLRWW